MPNIGYVLLNSTGQTLYMVTVSTLIAAIFGIPLGILLMVTDDGQILHCRAIHLVLSIVVNIFRSIPFIILLILLIPVTRGITGKAIGTTAAIVPLSIAAIPFMGRITETALREIDRGIIEAAEAMGASPWEIISKVLLPESLPALASGVTITVINLIGYSAMAGAIGGGGLGDLAVRYGYQRYKLDIMMYTVVILVAMVQLLQMSGDMVVRFLSRHR
jgi:D-methionine transport system permease protein